MANWVITGANRGIGLELARQVAERGDKVFAACRSASKELEGLKGVTPITGVDVTNPEAAAVIKKALGSETLDVLLKRNQRDYLTALNRTLPKNKRRDAWTRLSRRRRRTVRLIEELGLRTQRIEAMLRPIEDFSARVNELQVNDRRMGVSAPLRLGLDPRRELAAGDRHQNQHA